MIIAIFIHQPWTLGSYKPSAHLQAVSEHGAHLMNMKWSDVFLIVFAQFIMWHETGSCCWRVLRKGLKFLFLNIWWGFCTMGKLQSYFTCHMRFSLTFVLVLWLTVHVQSFWERCLRFFIYIFICCVQRNVGFQSILSDYLPLRVGVKLENSVLICFIVFAVLQEYFHMPWTTARDEEGKIVLPFSYVLDYIWIIFVPNNILITWW